MIARKRAGQNLLIQPDEYAKLLGITPQIASYNLQYLIDRGLVKGSSTGVLGTTNRFVMVYDITPRGIDVIEVVQREKLAINVNIFGSMIGSQLAIGDNIAQSQTGNINNFGDLRQFLGKTLNKDQMSELSPIIDELEVEVKSGGIKPSTLNRVKDVVTKYGPLAASVGYAIAKAIGLAP